MDMIDKKVEEKKEIVTIEADSDGSSSSLGSTYYSPSTD